jgi:hypothetical protein
MRCVVTFIYSHIIYFLYSCIYIFKSLLFRKYLLIIPVRATFLRGFLFFLDACSPKILAMSSLQSLLLRLLSQILLFNGTVYIIAFMYISPLKNIFGIILKFRGSCLIFITNNGLFYANCFIFMIS